ncbi:hypothetical protein TPL01_15990 [Sulfuriferula plumbiphila]|uniref:DsrE family protein n=1 Tax=Sulfuriferula plumbiphila TaxID=171865 RepID=A0A512L8I2_9PROT|nr:hypothetical protein [Sulfuriferula plumbiphila]BBP04022.1 hypothetical protein SFPGR_14440 [Sulfuriferula plumbiphila]GEP30461.1 hypothetical protein TPL01_15990 [Sulfuriferula plumbiphila]
MEMLFVISTDQGGEILAPLAHACIRKGIMWGCFFTNDGVRLLADSSIRSLMDAAKPALACEHSWQRFMAGESCPVELGSQTSHSALLASAARVVTI